MGGPNRLPVSTFQDMIVPFLQPDTKYLLFGDQAIHSTQFLCPATTNREQRAQQCITLNCQTNRTTGNEPSQVYNGVCMSRSQNLTVVSPDPLANFRLSGLNWTDITASAWPGNELQTNISTYVNKTRVPNQPLGGGAHHLRLPSTPRDRPYFEHGLFLIDNVDYVFGDERFVFQTFVQVLGDLYLVHEKRIGHRRRFVLKAFEYVNITHTTLNDRYASVGHYLLENRVAYQLQLIDGNVPR